MAKEITRIAKLEFNAGQAKPGPELAGLGIVMPEFTRAFNDETKDRNGEPVPVVITVYSDRSFKFETKTAPASYKIKQAAGIKSGAANAKTDIVGTITMDQLKEIAEYKLVDLNTNKIESAMKQIAGTAKNMGVVVEGLVDLKEAEAAAKAAAKDIANANAKEAALEEAAATAIETKGQAIEVNAIAQSAEEEGDK
ncbi:50S ribosomal protein L11 [Mycoplasma todarodis]|uniref:Large ribosomal subunit protein uL11 n=1 Tax=Mycoplasma todarodis TaxID=1937191 RepID=A0A4R0XJX1_9MOLU|nr:50S ribosomal protein L11 [Mycoplasma todarodis]TCG10933.1 50S ribosomal protein L11 [Mycoplasma todarodis]